MGSAIGEFGYAVWQILDCNIKKKTISFEKSAKNSTFFKCLK